MLAKFSVKKPFTVLVAVIAVIVFGVISYINMTPDLFPNINTPYALVVTTYPGASPEEAETEITEPMEQQLATVPNLENITSVSGANYSMIQLEFSDDVNMDTVSVDIREKIDQTEGSLPDTAGTPLVMKISLDMVPVTVAAAQMEGRSSAEVSEFTRENLQSALEGTEGVASVSAMGMTDNSIQIVLSQDRINEVNDRISAAILEQTGAAEDQIRNGISRAESGKNQIEAGKKQISEGQAQAAAQMESAKTKLQDKKDDLMVIKNNSQTISGLLASYIAASEDPITGAAIMEQIERQLAAMGINISSAEEAAAMQAQLESIDTQIDAIDAAIEDLSKQEATASFTLGNRYADLASAESTVTATVNQLQSALSEVQSSKEAALASADMTGVLTMNNISAILQAQNFSMPAGYISDGEAEMLVSVGDRIQDREELESLVLFDMGTEGEEPVRLSDIATVTYGGEGSETYAKINGNNGVLLSFTKQSSYATAEVADNIRAEFAKLEKEYDDLSFITLSDQGEYIHIVINSVLQNLLMGAALAILILIFFLRDIRPTFITAVSIPVSVIFAVVLMYFSGVSLNLISLAGLAIGVGMLVDNSIVVIENIYRLRALGYSRVQSAVSGAMQVAGAITASTLTTICVFAPIVFVDGMTRDIFMDLALTVTYSLMASLIIALTLVPAAAKGLLTKEAKNTVLGEGSRLMEKYKAGVRWSLGHRKLIIAAAFGLLIISTGLTLLKGFSFIPSMSTPQISATVQMPEESTLEETAAATDAVMEEVRKIDGVETAGAMLSSDAMGMLGMSGMTDGAQDVTSTMIYIVMDESKTENSAKVAGTMKKVADEYGCDITTSADMDMSAMIGGSGVAINLYSEDLDLLRETGENIENRLKNMKELEEVSDVNEDSSQELKITVDKNAAMEKGLTVAQIYQQVSERLTKESSATTMDQAGSSVDVVVENTTGSGFSQEDLENMKLMAEGADGTSSEVTLSSVADIDKDAALDTINRDNQKRSLQVTADVKDGNNVTLVSQDVRDMIEESDLIPDGVTIKYSGENEEIMDAMGQMLLMLIVGLILVYLVMVAQFQSLRSPFIIMFTIPLAFTGGMLGLLITGNELSVVSMMGFIMLMGIVVNNAIVLVDCINRLRLEGMETDDAITEAGAMRIRPVLMTAVTTVLGLVPLALGLGTGAEMMQPLAIVCIGGLIYATLMTLVIIPVMYRLLARRHMDKIEEEELEIVRV